MVCFLKINQGESVKYIIFDDLTVVIFSPIIIHSDMARKYAEKTPQTAGMVKLYDDQVACYGESVTLRIKSDPKRDTDIIKRSLDGYAI